MDVQWKYEHVKDMRFEGRGADFWESSCSPPTKFNKTVRLEGPMQQKQRVFACCGSSSSEVSSLGLTDSVAILFCAE
eukprot:s62_g23.t1